MTWVPSIDWATAMPAIEEWVLGASGLADGSVVWAFNAAPQARPYIELNISNTIQVHHDGVAEENNPMTFAPFTAVADHTSSSFHAVAHGRTTGDGPLELTTTGVLPAELTLAMPYWFIVLDVDHFQIAATFQDTGGNFMGNPITPVMFTDNGTGAITVSDTEDTTAAGVDVKRTASGLREVTLTLQCFADTGDGIQAMSILSTIVSSLALNVDNLNAAGVGVTEVGVAYLAGGVRQIEGRRGSILEPRAICDLTVYMDSELVDYIGSIAKIALSVNLEQVDGTPLEEIDLVIDVDET